MSFNLFVGSFLNIFVHCTISHIQSEIFAFTKKVGNTDGKLFCRKLSSFVHRFEKLLVNHVPHAILLRMKGSNGQTVYIFQKTYKDNFVRFFPALLDLYHVSRLKRPSNMAFLNHLHFCNSMYYKFSEVMSLDFGKFST